MIDIIIPTLLSGDRSILEWTLDQANKSPVVKNIIVVDNTETGSFTSSLDKVIVLSNKKNLFVNPSWNLGMEHVTSEYYMICNDDILSSTAIYNITNEALSDESIGLLTFRTIERGDINSYVREMSNIKHNDIKHSVDIPNDGRQGWIMAGRVSQWVPIPKDLLIWCGDDFIYRLIKQRGLKCVIFDYPVVHHKNTTINKVRNNVNIKPILENDKRVWDKIKNNIGGYLIEN